MFVRPSLALIPMAWNALAAELELLPAFSALLSMIAMALLERINADVPDMVAAPDRPELANGRHAHNGGQVFRLLGRFAQRFDPMGDASTAKMRHIDFGEFLGAHLEGADAFSAFVHLHNHARNRVAFGFDGGRRFARASGHDFPGFTAAHAERSPLRPRGIEEGVDVANDRFEATDFSAGLLDGRLHA
jgi:hypothetical protein